MSGGGDDDEIHSYIDFTGGNLIMFIDGEHMWEIAKIGGRSDFGGYCYFSLEGSDDSEKLYFQPDTQGENIPFRVLKPVKSGGGYVRRGKRSSNRKRRSSNRKRRKRRSSNLRVELYN